MSENDREIKNIRSTVFNMQFYSVSIITLKITNEMSVETPQLYIAHNNIDAEHYK